MILTGLLCVMVGITLGLVGAGGSVLTVPIFVYSAKMGAQEAVSLSLLVVSVTSLIGSLRYMTRGWVNLRLAAIFIVFGSAAAFAGGHFSYLLPGKTLLLFFGTLMLVTGMILFRKDGEEKDANLHCRPRFVPAMLISTALGILTGFLGVGGGFLIVPVLALLMKCSMRAAIGTSLLIISLNAMAGFAGHIAAQPVAWQSAAIYSTATVAGSLLGSSFAGRVPAGTLRKIFALLIIATGLFVISQNIPS